MNALSMRVLAVNAGIAQITRGPRSWVLLRRDLADLLAVMEHATRAANRAHKEVSNTLTKYEAKKQSMRTGIPVNEMVAHLCRRMQFPGK